MNALNFAKPLAIVSVVFGALATATAAQARTDVFVQLGVPGVTYGYVQPEPVYVQTYPAYTYRPYRTYPGYQNTYYPQRRGAWGDADGDGVPNLYDRDSRRFDADGDGVVNRYDRAPRNPYRY